MSHTMLELAIAQGQARDARDAAELREMHLEVGDAKSLEGMAQFASLESLSLFASETVSLRGLASLPALRALTIGAYALEDLDALETLPLRRLGITAQRLPDLGGLSSGTLLDLVVSDCGLRSLDGTALPRLRRLDVSMNEIADLAPLARFPALRNLDLQGNPAADIGVIASLPEMRVLSLSGMKNVRDIGPLGSLRRLTRLALTGVRAKRREAVAHVAPEAILDVGGAGAGGDPPAVAWPDAAVRAGLATEDELADVVEWDVLEWNAEAWRGASSLPGVLTLLAGDVTAMDELESTPSVLSLVVRCAIGRESDPWALKEVDFSGLSRARRLVRLHVQHPIDSLERLPPLPGLRHLHVHGDDRRRPVSLSGIDRFESLGTLSISGGATDKDLLARMPQVRLVHA